MDLVDCQPACPFRPPWWRWRMANHLVEQRLRSRRRWLDAWVKRGVRLVESLAGRRGDVPRAAVKRLDPALFQAHRVRFSPDPGMRVAVESWLLAGLSADEIATRSGLPADVVEAYEALFFDVRGRLGCVDFVLFTAVDPAGSLGGGVPGPDVVTRLLAYRGGPFVADAVLALREDMPASPTPGAAAAVVDPLLAAAVRMLFRAKTIPVDRRTAPLLVRLYDRLRAIEIENDARSALAVCRPVVAAPDLVEAVVDPSPEHDRLVGHGAVPEFPAAVATDPSPRLAEPVAPSCLIRQTG